MSFTGPVTQNTFSCSLQSWAENAEKGQAADCTNRGPYNEEAKQLRQIPPSSKTHLLVHSTTVAEDSDSLPIKNKCENVIKGNNLRNYGLNN